MAGRTEWREVFHNHFPCDFECENLPVGWVRVTKKNRSLGGNESVEVYMACADHMSNGEAVYPEWVED